MAAKPPRFSLTVVLVTIAHALVLAFIVIGGVSSCIQRKEEQKVLPIEFMVAVDDGPVNDPVKPVEHEPPPEVKPPVPEPEPPPVQALVPEKKPEVVKKPPEKKPEVKKPPEKKPDPPKPIKKPEAVKKPPEKKPFEKGQRITRPNPNPPPPNLKRLSPEEVAKLLAMGATVGNRNLVPEGDSLYYEVIRRKLYNAWVQPGSVPRSLKAEIEILMNAQGDIINRRLLRASGNAVMDQSVMEAVRSVPRIENLSAEFIQRKNGRVTITFELGTGAA